MADGPERGLAALDQVDTAGELASYYLVPATRADLLRRLGRAREALGEYERALTLVTNESERRFLQARTAEIRAAEEK